MLRVKEWHKRFFRLDKTKKALLYWEQRDAQGWASEDRSNSISRHSNKTSSLGSVAPGQLVISEATTKPKSTAMAKLAAALDDDNNKDADKDKDMERTWKRKIRAIEI